MAIRLVSKSPDTSEDIPLMELSKANPSLKRLISKGKSRGYITYDELNEALPQDQFSSDQIDDVMSTISEMGISLVDEEEVEEGGLDTDFSPQYYSLEEEDGEEGEVASGKTDDPVRLYLREMGNVDLLSRDGEISISKRIESGRAMMMGGFCESPLTARMIDEWREKLEKGKILLREIVSIDTSSQFDLENELEEEAPEGDEELKGGEDHPPLSAVEQTLLPKTLGLMGNYIEQYSQLWDHHQSLLSQGMTGEAIAKDADYQKIKEKLLRHIDEIKLNATSIEGLMEEHNKYNRPLAALALGGFLTGCDKVRHTFGLDHAQHDAFSIPTNPPLSIPPDYDQVPPPAASQESPGKTSPHAQAIDPKIKAQDRLVKGAPLKKKEEK